MAELLSVRFRQITQADDLPLAKIIRDNLKANGLDIPGTVYFDDNLNHLSDFYLVDSKSRFYYIVEDEASGAVLGGIGFAKIDIFGDCAELQKLYLSDEAKGNGLGYKLIDLVQKKAKELGYTKLYLETHDNLAVAIHEYEKSGFHEIERPKGVVHGAMNRFFLKDI